MDPGYIASVFDHLRSRGIEVHAGLTGAEFRSAEGRFDFRFPHDLRALLSRGLPVGRKFPDWRGAPGEFIREHLDRPLEGILVDVEVNGFWMPSWGPRPRSLEGALSVARMRVREAPLLIPVCGHRYIPAEPYEAGNPIFSAVQTDIIVYGLDLADYLRADFGVPAPGPPPTTARATRFWSELAAGN